MGRRRNARSRGRGRGQSNGRIAVQDIEPFLCSCGCGRRFWRTSPQQRYIDATHRKRRYDADQRQALYSLIYDLLRYAGATLQTAARKAQECIDHSVTAWYRMLAALGLRYDSKQRCWVRG